MRNFTVQEANAFVPSLQATFGYIEKLRRKVIRIVGELEVHGHRADLEASDVPVDLPEPVRTKRLQIAEALGEIRGLVRELETHGLIVKQLDGRVEFRSLRGQRPVYLTWRKGESSIDRWHEVWSDDPDTHQPVDQFFPKALMN